MTSTLIPPATDAPVAGLAITDRDPSRAIDLVAASPFQHYRELSVNGFEALTFHCTLHPRGTKGCPRIIRWYLEMVDGVPKLAIADTGCGMPADDLVGLLGSLHSSSKRLGAAQNHGTGAKVAALPFNHDGIEYTSLVPGAETAWTITLHRSAFGYEIAPQGLDDDGVMTYVAAVPIAELPPLIRRAGHGTRVVLRGMSADHDTGYGPEGSGTKWLTKYLNERFLTVPHGVTFSSVTERTGTDPVPRGHKVRGEAYLLEKTKAASGAMQLEHAYAEWWIRDPEKSKLYRDEIGTALSGHVAVGCGGEAYRRYDGKRATSTLHGFGITAGTADVILHLTIQHPGLQVGDDRDSLKIDGADALEWLAIWGEEFGSRLPKALVDHIVANSGAAATTDRDWLAEQLSGHAGQSQLSTTGSFRDRMARLKQRARRRHPAPGTPTSPGAGPAPGCPPGTPPGPNPADATRKTRRKRKVGAGTGPGSAAVLVSQKYRNPIADDLATAEWRGFLGTELEDEGDVAAVYIPVPGNGHLIFNEDWTGYQAELDTWGLLLMDRQGPLDAKIAAITGEVQKQFMLACQANVIARASVGNTTEEALSADGLTPRELTAACRAARATGRQSIKRNLGTFKLAVAGH